MVVSMFSGFFEHFAVSALVCFTLMGLFGYLFARDRFRRFINGLGWLVASIFTSPVVFLRKAVGVVATYAPDREKELRSSDQYLLNNLLMGLQAGVILVVIGSFAAGLVTAWNAFLPPPPLREEIKQVRERIGDSEASLGEWRQKQAGLDEAWSRERDPAMAAARKERQERQAQGRRDQQRLASQAAGTSAKELLVEMKGYLAQVGNLSTPEELGSAKERLDRIARYSWGWYIQQGDRNHAARWAQAWHTAALAAWELDNLSEESVRIQHQRDLADVQGNTASLEAALGNDREYLEGLRAQAKFNFRDAFLSLLGTVIGSLFLVWLLGSLLELLAMGVHMAGDVRKLRHATERSEGGEAREQAA